MSNIEKLDPYNNPQYKSESDSVLRVVKYDYNTIKLRGFEYVKRIDRDVQKIIDLPKRSTSHSAGYDFVCPNYVYIAPRETIKIRTGIKAYMCDDEYLALHIRSSLGIKYNLVLSNCTGIIDSDYYNNPDNDGEIIVAITNMGTDSYEIEPGERFVQGIFSKYLIADNDDVFSERTGGIGSTDK